VFVGTYIHNMDEKGRVVLPSTHRRVLAGGDPEIVITKSPDGCLSVLPKADFERQAEVMRNEATDAAGRRRLRIFSSQAELQTLDKAGRLMVSEGLRHFGGLEPGAEVAVIGNYDHIEFWNPQAWQANQERGEREYLETDEEETTT
jgi:MraZ protein